MKNVHLVFPHQLFQSTSHIGNSSVVYLVEAYLFFKQYPFHKQKLAFHRASMKHYESYLKVLGYKVHYIEAVEDLSDIRKLIPHLKQLNFSAVSYVDPTDNWLQKRIESTCKEQSMSIRVLESPLFLNSKTDLQEFFSLPKKSYSQTSFYISERKKRNMLLGQDGKPRGGKWTFDKENRKKYPAKKTPPPIHYPHTDELYKEAREYVAKNFPNHPGELPPQSYYPTNFESTKLWFHQFLEQRFADFGAYEDAIVAEYSILNHSVLTPMLNVGLISPQEIVNTTLAYGKTHEIPINSLEGFLRQIVGWREFIRGIYEVHGSEARRRNFWGFTKKIPSAFYTATTGITPVDLTIKKVLRTGYCHHIERLMVLGNFMLLCEFDPDEVYQWFMELFIDSYDWVMVPNVYGMSQFADGGLMATKPYISGSNYLMKMSNYKPGSWQAVWDGLFWSFMHVHRDFFQQNPRLGMLVHTFDKMSEEKKKSHLKNAEKFLSELGF
ncbi:MAG: cryptochrome/photolyase family protein [Flavobacteriaceae bacterium]